MSTDLKDLFCIIMPWPKTHILIHLNNHTYNEYILDIVSCELTDTAYSTYDIEYILHI